jgi:hypothetical protein
MRVTNERAQLDIAKYLYHSETRTTQNDHPRTRPRHLRTQQRGDLEKAKKDKIIVNKYNSNEKKVEGSEGGRAGRADPWCEP